MVEDGRKKLRQKSFSGILGPAHHQIHPVSCALCVFEVPSFSCCMSLCLPAQQGLHSGGAERRPKQHSPSPSKQLQNRRPEQQKYDSGSTGKDDSFAAALSALEKLEVTPSTSTPLAAEPGGKQLPLTGGGDKRELSPSVAAMFDSISAAASAGNQPPYEASSSEVPAGIKEGLSPTLKAMLKMEEEDGGLASESHASHQEVGSMPEAIQKLMHHPRGPLLPHPASPFQPSFTPLPPQHQQMSRTTRSHFVHAPRGGQF